MLPKIASEKPRIINTKKLKKASLEALLADPHMLTPPELGVGEFLAGMFVGKRGSTNRACPIVQMPPPAS